MDNAPNVARWAALIAERPQNVFDAATLITGGGRHLPRHDVTPLVHRREVGERPSDVDADCARQDADARRAVAASRGAGSTRGIAAAAPAHSATPSRTSAHASAACAGKSSATIGRFR